MDNMDLVQQFLNAIKGRRLKVALPEGHDARVLRAARQLLDEDLAAPVVLGAGDQIEAAAQKAGISLSGLEIIDPREGSQLDDYASAYAAARGLNERVARRMVRRPLIYAGMMVRRGVADTMVGGVSIATANVIQAGVLTVGYAPGIRTASSFFLMVIPELAGQRDRAMVFADCAVNVLPTAKELADIALASESSAAKLLDEEPYVALLSFSTQGSASHEQVDRVTQAVEIVRQRAPQAKIDGEFQADAAIVAEVAGKKLKRPSVVAGKANVLIFPDLNSGNIGYKLTQYLGGARAIGPFLQGFARPMSDLSRGASVDDIVATSAICLAQVQADKEPRS